MSNQEIPLEELLEQSRQDVAKAIAAVYTVEQLSAAIKIRLATENDINSFDAPEDPNIEVCTVGETVCDDG
jgi:hypothetical protein